MSDSAVRIEVSLRAAMIAKAALDLLNLEPCLCRLQLAEVARLIGETDKWLQAKAQP